MPKEYLQYKVQMLQGVAQHLDFPTQLIDFFSCFQHVIRIAFVYSFNGCQGRLFIFALTSARKRAPDIFGNDHILLP